jgi:hypothetical protein
VFLCYVVQFFLAQKMSGCIFWLPVRTTQNISHNSDSFPFANMAPSLPLRVVSFSFWCEIFPEAYSVSAWVHIKLTATKRPKGSVYLS